MVKNEKIVRTVVRPGQQPTEVQIKEIEAAMAQPVVPYEDAPELTLEHNMLKWQRWPGAGETRLMDNAINDPQLVAK